MKSNNNAKGQGKNQIFQEKERMIEQNSEQQRISLMQKDHFKQGTLCSLQQKVAEFNKHKQQFQQMKKTYATLIKQVHRTLPIINEFNVHTIVKKDSEKNQIKIYLELYLVERSLNTLMSVELQKFEQKKKKEQTSLVHKEVVLHQEKQFNRWNEKIRKILIRKNYIQNMTTVLREDLNKWQKSDRHKFIKRIEEKGLSQSKQILTAQIMQILPTNRHNFKVINENQTQGMNKLQQRSFFNKTLNFFEDNLLEENLNTKIMSDKQIVMKKNFKNIDFQQQIQKRKTIDQIRQLNTQFQKDYSELKNFLFNQLRKARYIGVHLIQQQDIKAIEYIDKKRERKIYTSEESVEQHIIRLINNNRQHKCRKNKKEQNKLKQSEIRSQTSRKTGFNLIEKAHRIYYLNCFLQENIENILEYMSKWMSIKDQAEICIQIPLQFRDYQQKKLEKLLRQKDYHKCNFKRLKKTYLVLVDECLDRNIKQIFQIGILSKCDQNKFHLDKNSAYQCCKYKIDEELYEIYRIEKRSFYLKQQNFIRDQYNQELRGYQNSEIARKYGYYKRQQIEIQLENIKIYQIKIKFIQQQLQHINECVEKYNNQIMNENKAQYKRSKKQFTLESAMQNHILKRGESQDNSEEQQGNVDQNELKIRMKKRGNKQKASRKIKREMFIKKVTPNTIIEKSLLKNDLKNSKGEQMNPKQIKCEQLLNDKFIT